MLPKDWRPRVAERLIRIGPNEDGGYVVPARAVAETDLLLGVGLGDDWRFEADFPERSGCRVVCYDHTVSPAYWKWHFARHTLASLYGKGSIRRAKDTFLFLGYRRFFNGKNAEHRVEKVGYSGLGAKSIDEILSEHEGSSIFVKMDIERWEYRVLDQIASHPGRINGFVIEFHDVHLHRQRISDFMTLASGSYRLVHIHANNCCGVDPNGDPLIVEMTWANKTITTRQLLREARYPISGLDFPNKPEQAGIELKFEDDE